MLTVISWNAARRARRPLVDWVQRVLTDKPTLLAIVSDRYTQESYLRPFVPVAERFGDRLHVILAAEWDEEDRERDGEVTLLQLGLAPAARHRVLHDEGKVRTGVVLRRKQPVALIELFFEERRSCGQGKSTLSLCPGTKRDDGPRRDRFELVELD